MTPEQIVADLVALHEILPGRDRDIVGLDLETSGFDPLKEHIIEISLARLTPGGAVTPWATLVNPRLVVDPKVLELTGISQADLDAAEPWSHRLATIVAAGLAGCDFFGYHVRRFDLDFLAQACAKVGVDFNYADARVVDGYALWSAVEKRDLSSFVEKFARRPHAGAHRAAADVAGTAAGLAGFLRVHDEVPRDVQALHDLAFPRDPSWVDADGKIVWRDGVACLGAWSKRWGGYSLAQLAADRGYRGGRGYLEWMLEARFSSDVKKIIRDLLYGGQGPAAPAAPAAPATEDAPF